MAFASFCLREITSNSSNTAYLKPYLISCLCLWCEAHWQHLNEPILEQITIDNRSLRMLELSSVRAHTRVQISGGFFIPFAPEYDCLNSPFTFEQLEMLIKINMNLRVLFSHFRFIKCTQFRFSFTGMNLYKIFIYKIRHNLISSFQFVFFTNFIIHSLLFWFYSY